MRKRVFGVKFSRSRKSRGALLRSLLRALILDGKVTTTKTKSKYLVSEFERLVNTAKASNLNARRRAMKILGNQKELIEPLFEKIVPTFVDKTGGFVKIIPLVARKGDSAERGRVEFTKPLISKKETPKTGEKDSKKAVSKKATKEVVKKKVNKK